MNISDNSTVDPITLIITVIGILILLGVAITILFIFRGFLKALLKLAYFLRYVAAGVLILAIFPFSFYLFGIGVAIAANFIIHRIIVGKPDPDLELSPDDGYGTDDWRYRYPPWTISMAAWTVFIPAWTALNIWIESL